MKVTTASAIATVLLVLVTHPSVVNAQRNHSGDYFYYDQEPYEPRPSCTDEDLIKCILLFYPVLSGSSAAQDTFCDVCRIKLQMYAKLCLSEALAEKYNSTIATVCEKDIDCIPNTKQQACLLQYGVAPSLLAGDGGNFCDECRDYLVEYTSTCLGESAANSLGNTLEIACGASGSAAATVCVGVAIVALIQALFNISD